MYVYIKRVRAFGRLYYYLVVEEYIGNGKRRRIAHISVKRILERFKDEVGDMALSVVRGAGFEPAQAYAIGSSARPLWPGSGTPAFLQ